MQERGRDMAPEMLIIVGLSVVDLFWWLRK